MFVEHAWSCPWAVNSKANGCCVLLPRLWRKVPLTERAAYLMKAADVMDANIPELARLLTLEQGTSSHALSPLLL